MRRKLLTALAKPQSPAPRTKGGGNKERKDKEENSTSNKFEVIN